MSVGITDTVFQSLNRDQKRCQRGPQVVAQCTDNGTALVLSCRSFGLGPSQRSAQLIDRLGQLPNLAAALDPGPSPPLTLGHCFHRAGHLGQVTGNGTGQTQSNEDRGGAGTGGNEQGVPDVVARQGHSPCSDEATDDGQQRTNHGQDRNTVLEGESPQ